MPSFPGLELTGAGLDEIEVVRWDGTGAPPAPARDAEMWVPRFGRVDHAQAIAALPGLRVVQLLTAGYDQVSTPPPITLCNAAGIHDGAVAEWALAAMLASVRALPAWVSDQPDPALAIFESDTLVGATVLLLGHGGIGQAIERRLAGFEVQIIRVASRARPGVHGPDELPELLAAADVVVLALPLTDATRGLVDGPFLARLRDGALIVNVSRGAIIDQPALEAELTSGRLSAALDVATPDPLPAASPLRGLANLLYTPHVAGVTRSVFPRLSELISAQARRLRDGEALINVVSGVDRPPSRAHAPQA